MDWLWEAAVEEGWYEFRKRFEAFLKSRGISEEQEKKEG